MRGKRESAIFNMAFSFVFVRKTKGGLFMLENRFKTKLIREIQEMLPGSIITHLDPNEIQGIPDLLILYRNKWAALEGKKNATASVRPNQAYYVSLMDGMSFASFIYPENKESVLDALYFHFTR
jgi:hypothetical protein